MDATTIKIHRDTKQELDHFREYYTHSVRRYNPVIKK